MEKHLQFNVPAACFKRPTPHALFWCLTKLGFIVPLFGLVSTLTLYVQDRFSSLCTSLARSPVALLTSEHSLPAPLGIPSIRPAIVDGSVAHPHRTD